MSTARDRVLGALRPLLEDAAGPDRIVATRELVDAGIPKRYAESIARASRRLDTTDDAHQLAEQWADTIDADLARDRAKGTDPAELAADVPRW